MKNTIRLILICLFIFITFLTADCQVTWMYADGSPMKHNPLTGELQTRTDTVISRELIYKTDRPGLLINGNKVIISEDYEDLVLEPIPGKVTRWTITREEEAPVPVITTVENTELTYTGQWEHPSGTWGTISHSSTPGATAKYSFIGNHIDVFGTYASHHGVLEYTINNGSPKSVNLASPTRQDGVLIISEPVPAGFNTITFKCISGTVLIDYLRITK